MGSLRALVMARVTQLFSLISLLMSGKPEVCSLKDQLMLFKKFKKITFF
jgi:hypothetical protein